MKVELKNWHDVAVTVMTENEEVTIPASGSCFIFAQKFVVKVATPDAPAAAPEVPADPAQ